ncbi:hypothetical protein V8G54_029866 [Vigna mungo]|uniref:Uncharacterized protein n=1 Tax=Vigna mungo TaxID=3915 RepID=A0AAQ3MV54_VIGMU
MINPLNATQNPEELIVSLLVKKLTISSRSHPINHFIPLLQSSSLIQTPDQNKKSRPIRITPPLSHTTKQPQRILGPPNLTQIRYYHIESLHIPGNPTELHLHQHLLHLRIQPKRILLATKLTNAFKHGIVRPYTKLKSSAIHLSGEPLSFLELPIHAPASDQQITRLFVGEKLPSQILHHLLRVTREAL